MTITLTKDGTSLELPEDLIWSDELTRTTVAQTIQRGIDGHLIVDAMDIVGGPITLIGDADSAWVERGNLKTFRAWSRAGQVFQLNIRGEIFTVIPDYGDQEESRALAMTAVIQYSDMEDGDYYCSLVLRFIEI